MKTKSLFTILLIVVMGIMLSCASAPKELSPEHESLIGTKWVTVASNLDEYLVFTDSSKCTYTSNGKQQVVSYTVQENKITIASGLFIYTLREDTLYLAGLPMYVKSQ